VQLGAFGRIDQVRHARRYLHIIAHMQLNGLAARDAGAALAFAWRAFDANRGGSASPYPFMLAALGDDCA
jgi:hypothetical protein